MGHFVKEKIGLHLSGLALISVAAIWVPINVGTLVFEVLEAPGETVLPGIEVPLDLPMHGWLIIAASCVPTWAALAFRYRGHLLTHGTIAATGATVALAVAVFGGSWEWRIASIAVLVPLLIPARHRLMGTSFRPNAAPLYYTAQAALALTGAVLVVGYIMGEANGHSVTVAALAGIAVYVLANRVTPRLAHEYPIAVLPVVGLLFSAAEQGLDGRYFDALLMMVAVVYVAAGRIREGRYQTGIFRSSAWPALQPAYVVGVVAAALAAAGPAVDRLNAVACWTAFLSCDGGIAWPDTEPVVRIAVLYAAAAVSAVLARWWGRLLWSALSGASLFAAFLLSLGRLDILPVDYRPVATGLLSCAYLTLGVYVRRSVHGVSMLLWALAAALVSVFWALSTNDPAVLSVALPPALVVFAAGSVMVQRWQMETATTWLAGVLASRRIEEEVADAVPGRDAVRRRLSAALLAVAGVILPVWTTYLVRWAGIPDDWVAGVDVLAVAAAFGYLSHRLWRRGLSAHAAVLSALCVLLAVAAPVFHFAAQDLTWTLAGLLFGDVALAAIAAYVLQRPNLAYAVLLLLPVPYALTLHLAGLDIPYSAVCWGVLAAAYFAVAVLLLRRPVFSSIPVFAAGHAIGVLSLALATHGLVEGGGLAAANAAYLVHVGLLAALAYLLKSQWYGLGAALLFTMPYTLTLYDQYGESPDLFALPSAALAYGWTGLAVVSVAAGPIMERVLTRRWGVLPVVGHLLLAGAAFAAIDGVEARRVVYGAIAVAAAASASLTHSGLASGLVDQASRGLRIGADRVRESLTLTYMAVAAVLTPLWVIEILSLSTTDRAAQGLAIALLNPLYAAGALMVRRWAGWLYTVPLHAAMLGVSVYGAAAAYEDEMLRTASLLTVTVAYAIVLAGHRRPVFVYPLLLAGHLTLSSVLVLSDLSLSLHVMGVLFTPAALAMAGLAGRQLLPAGNAFSTTSIWKSWATPFVLFAVVDVGASIVLAAREDWARPGRHSGLRRHDGAGCYLWPGEGAGVRVHCLCGGRRYIRLEGVRPRLVRGCGRLGGAGPVDVVGRAGLWRTLKTSATCRRRRRAVHCLDRATSELRHTPVVARAWLRRGDVLCQARRSGDIRAGAARQHDGRSGRPGTPLSGNGLHVAKASDRLPRGRLATGELDPAARGLGSALRPTLCGPRRAVSDGNLLLRAAPRDGPACRVHRTRSRPAPRSLVFHAVGGRGAGLALCDSPGLRIGAPRAVGLSQRHEAGIHRRRSGLHSECAVPDDRAALLPARRDGRPDCRPGAGLPYRRYRVAARSTDPGCPGVDNALQQMDLVKSRPRLTWLDR